MDQREKSGGCIHALLQTFPTGTSEGAHRDGDGIPEKFFLGHSAGYRKIVATAKVHQSHVSCCQRKIVMRH